MAAKIDHDDIVTCPICFEHFTDPKQLPCFHTFCHPCLKSYIITHLGGEGKKGQDFPCPVCRQVVSITDKDLSSEKIADNIPGNQLLASLIERSVGSGNEVENVCGPCSRENKELAATHWCRNCLEFLCENCTTSHKRLDQTRHKLVPMCDVTVEVNSEKLLDIEEPCMKHAGKVLEVYCVDHKEMCCVICLATSHRRCDNISTIDEMVSDPKESEKFEHFNSKLNDIDKKSEDLRIKTEENLTTLNTTQEDISQNVSSTIQKAKDKLDQLQTKFDLKFQQKHKEESTKLLERKDKIEIFQGNVKKGQKLLQTVREHGSPKQQFITREKIKQQIKEQAKSLREDLKDAKCVDYTIKLDGTLMSIAQNIDSLGEIDMKSTFDLSENLTDIVDVTDELDGESEKPTQNFSIMELDVRCVNSTDAIAHFPGGTYLEDGKIVLCNWNYRKLQAFDKSGKLLFGKSHLNYKPADACCIANTEIAVSFDGQSYITKYKVTQNQVVETGTIQCKQGPWGLAATKDMIIVGYATEIDILSLDGTFKRTLSSRRGDRYSYVTTTPNGKVYYIDQEEVVCKALDGSEISRFSHPELKQLYGIAIDKFGNIYVIGNASQNVCVFSPDGLHRKIFLKDLKYAFKVEFNPEGNEFFVTTDFKGQIYTSDLFISK